MKDNSPGYSEWWSCASTERHPGFIAKTSPAFRLRRASAASISAHPWVLSGTFESIDTALSKRPGRLRAQGAGENHSGKAAESLAASRQVHRDAEVKGPSCGALRLFAQSESAPGKFVRRAVTRRQGAVVVSEGKR